MMWLRATTSACEWAGLRVLIDSRKFLHVADRRGAGLGELLLLGAEPAGGELDPAAIARLDPAVLALVADAAACPGPSSRWTASRVSGRRHRWRRSRRRSSRSNPWGPWRRRRSARRARAFSRSFVPAQLHRSTVWAPHSRMPPPWKSKKPRQPPSTYCLIVRPPGGRAEPQIPVDLVLGRLGLAGKPVVARARVKRVGVDGRELAELAAAAQIGGEDESWPCSAAACRPGRCGRSGASCRPGPGSRRWSSSRAFRSRCPCPPWRRRSRPSCASGRRWRSARRRCPRRGSISRKSR